MSVIERFLLNVKISTSNFYNDSACWEWQASKVKGYGRFCVNYKGIYCHRFLYEYYHGMVSPDLIIHHKCRNRKCCNVLHLEQITNKKNVLSGVGPTAIHAHQTYCKHGHEFTLENTYSWDGYRHCKECHKRRAKEQTQRNRLLSINQEVDKN